MQSNTYTLLLHLETQWTIPLYIIIANAYHHTHSLCKSNHKLDQGDWIPQHPYPGHQHQSLAVPYLPIMVVEHHTRHLNSWTKDARYRGVILYFVSKEGKLDWTMQTASS